MKTIQRNAPYHLWNLIWTFGWFIGVALFVIWFTQFGPLASGADFTVENKVTRTFVVENKIPPAKPEPVLPTDPDAPAPSGYQWVKRGDGPWKLEKFTAAAPAVVAPPTFRDPSHICAKCGREQRVVAGFNTDGTHNHQCASCGYSWRH